MFERFTDEARAVVIAARHECRRRNERTVGTQHLLLALLHEPGPVRDLFAAIGVDHRRVDAAIDAYRSPLDRPRTSGTDADADADTRADRPADDDAAALASLGIDLDRVRHAVEAAFGEGALTQAALGLDAAHRRRPARWRRRRPLRSSDDDRHHHCAHHDGALAFAPRAKTVLELSLREALRLKHRSITAEHIALAILREGQGLACAVLGDAQADLTRLRRELEAAAQARRQPRS